MILEILCGLQFIIICILFYVIWNISKKIDVYEAWIIAFQKTLESTLNNMKTLDKGGAFEADDEVGEIFRALKGELFVLSEFVAKGKVE